MLLLCAGWHKLHSSQRRSCVKILGHPHSIAAVVLCTVENVKHYELFIMLVKRLATSRGFYLKSEFVLFTFSTNV